MLFQSKHKLQDDLFFQGTKQNQSSKLHSDRPWRNAAQAPGGECSSVKRGGLLHGLEGGTAGGRQVERSDERKCRVV